MNKSPKPEITTKTLRGFEHINRYWDKTRENNIAKILPGEFYVTRHEELIATVLGSCVSACIWDSRNHIGGMNHFMLPITDKEIADISWANRNLPSDATRYGNYAMEHLINEILKNGGSRPFLQAKVFGGGRVLNQMTDVGKKNALFVLDYLKLENITLLAQDMGDIYPRKLIFDPMTGKALVKKLTTINNETITKREQSYRQNLTKKPVEGDIELF
jgi:chemotaxis protein CheD